MSLRTSRLARPQKLQCKSDHAICFPPFVP
jgi:hypothetical protein